MTHLTENRYRVWVAGTMTIYIALMLLVFPLAKHADNAAARAALAIACVSPVLVVIWLAMRRIMSSDELQQRLHLLALSAATGIVAAASLVAGFLQSVRVIVVDGDVLIWVFPALCIGYGLSRFYFNRRYGGAGCEG
ncbi:MAG: hypothetical protein JSR26_00400 [Proteobacteria bacterium]|nr:hypothetical protein [Pseudomonadota bacterium]